MLDLNALLGISTSSKFDLKAELKSANTKLDVARLGGVEAINDAMLRTMSTEIRKTFSNAKKLFEVNIDLIRRRYEMIGKELTRFYEAEAELGTEEAIRSIGQEVIAKARELTKAADDFASLADKSLNMVTGGDEKRIGLVVAIDGTRLLSDLNGKICDVFDDEEDD